MPIYEYGCTVCGNRFERLRSFSQMDDEAPCPECDSESKRQLSVFAAFSSSSDGQMSAVTGGGCAAGSCAGCTSGSCPG